MMLPAYVPWSGPGLFPRLEGVQKSQVVCWQKQGAAVPTLQHPWLWHLLEAACIHHSGKNEVWWGKFFFSLFFLRGFTPGKYFEKFLRRGQLRFFFFLRRGKGRWGKLLEDKLRWRQGSVQGNWGEDKNHKDPCSLLCATACNTQVV